jgi:hypothetical protein
MPRRVTIALRRRQEILVALGDGNGYYCSSRSNDLRIA